MEAEDLEVDYFMTLPQPLQSRRVPLIVPASKCQLISL